MHTLRLALAAAVLALPGTALACPPAPDHGAALGRLLAEARTAPTETEGRAVSARMWALWTDAPDETAQEMLDRGMARRESYDFAGALEAFDALVAYCPDYAEGYNQRAFVNFLRADYALAVGDLERAIALSPRHVAAISGLGLTLMALGRTEAAQEMLRRAVDLNPWIPERNYLLDRREPPGKAL